MKRRAPELAPLPPHPGVLHLLGVTVLALSPLAARLPWWISAVVAAAVVWRACVALRRWHLPNAWIRGALAFAGVASVYVYFGRINGLVAGAALLAIATALKLAELRDRRDLRILVALLYFTLVVNFLYSQEIWTIAYLLACTWLVTAVLLESNHPQAALPGRTSLHLAGVLTAQALPLMAVMFILFPRIPGPLWGLPADSGARAAGLSDSMSPGDIRKLVLSDAIAFRVHFDGTAPPPQQRYWRGPVFTHYDGRKWTPGFTSRTAPRYALEGAPVRYRITLEASRSRWLFALDLPDAGDLPADSALNGYGILVARQDNGERRTYTLVSYPHYVLAPRLGTTQREQDLALPLHLDPRTRALAARWRAEGLTATGIVGTALRLYADGKFRYTLEPPPVGHDAIDDFLFDTRAGFCEHFASSFTFLMRAAGIPARIVTGYQGGTKNPYGDYYTIRQEDAHAWSEVWLAGRGWVRIDPTAAAAPMRIDDGINAAMAGVAGLPAFLTPQWRTSWRHAFQARWDWVNQQWNHFVLGYGPDLQTRFMALLGLASWRAMLLTLTAAVTLLLGILALTLMHGTRARPTPDAARRLWQRATRKLERHGLQQGPAEGPRAFAQRVGAQQPQFAAWMGALYDAYVRARYLAPGDDANLAALGRAARAPLPRATSRSR